jgi:15-cis-phytoene synthase
MSDYVQELVAKGDKDRYLSSLFAPPDARPHLLALYAFNLEITRIHETVSNPQIGLIRHQWWLDTVDGIYAGQTQNHPIAQALATAIERANLPKHALRNLITAHEFALFDDVMPTLSDLEGHLGETSSSLIQMAALILGDNPPEAAGLAGVAQGIASVLRAKRKSFLPADMVQELGQNETIEHLKAHAQKRLQEARSISIVPAALPAFLPVSLTSLYLSRITPNSIKDISQLRRQFALWWAARNNRF